MWDFGCWMLDVGFGMLDVRCGMLECGFTINKEPLTIF